MSTFERYSTPKQKLLLPMMKAEVLDEQRFIDIFGELPLVDKKKQ